MCEIFRKVVSDELPRVQLEPHEALVLTVISVLSVSFQDVNRNNVINYTEFLAAALEAQGTIEEYRLAEAFDLIDTDDSGCISRDDLKKILGASRDDEYIDRLISEADFKKDGKISYEEFLHFFSERKHDQVYSIYEEANGSNGRSREYEAVLHRFGLIVKGMRRRRLDSSSEGSPRSSSHKTSPRSQSSVSR